MSLVYTHFESNGKHEVLVWVLTPKRLPFIAFFNKLQFLVLHIVLSFVAFFNLFHTGYSRLFMCAHAYIIRFI